MTACSPKSPSGAISSLQKRASKAEQKVQNLYDNDFQKLIDDFSYLENYISPEKDISKELTLLQAYLQQFESERPMMLEELDFTKQQLSDLSIDLKNNIYDDNTIQRYIQDEENALHIIEAQIIYFQEKFDNQREVVRGLKK